MIGCKPVLGGPGPRLQRLADRIGAGNFTGASIDALVGAAAYPEGFRLLLHDAAREPEFRAEMDRFHNAMVTIARRELAAMIPTASGRGSHGWPRCGQSRARDSTATKASA